MPMCENCENCQCEKDKPEVNEPAGSPENTQRAGDGSHFPKVHLADNSGPTPEMTEEEYEAELARLKELSEKNKDAFPKPTPKEQRLAANFSQDLMKFIPEHLRNLADPTDEQKAEISKCIESYVKYSWLKKYHLENVDIQTEYAKIVAFTKAKKIGDKKAMESNHCLLSRSQRDALVGYMLIFEYGPKLKQRIEELKNKPDRTPEEEELLANLNNNSDNPEAVTEFLEQTENPKSQSSEEQEHNAESNSESTPEDQGRRIEETQAAPEEGSASPQN